MKKEYINPEMEIVKIATSGMIATSNPVDLGGAGDYSGGGGLSGAPEFELWDDSELILPNP